MDFQKISNELGFDLGDIPVLVEILQFLVENMETTDRVIQYWEDNCFRANDFEEILEQFDDVKDIKEIGNRIFILPSKTLVVIGYGF